MADLDAASNLAKQTQAVAINYALIALVFVYTGLVFWLFQRRDHTDRVLMLLEATKLEGQRNQTFWFKIKRKAAYLVLLIDFIQLCALVCLPTIKWPLNKINVVIRLLTINLNFLDEQVNVVFFWFCFVLYGLVGLSGSLRALYEWWFDVETEANEYEEIARDIMLGVLFIPAAQVFFGMLNCDLNSPPRIQYMPGLQCWRGKHAIFGSFALLAVLVLLPAGLLKEMRENARDQTYQYIPKFRLINAAFEFSTVGVLIFLDSIPLAAILPVTLACAALFAYNIRVQPCLASGREINHYACASYAGACWTGISAMIAYGIDDETDFTSVAILLIGYPCVMYMAMRWSRRRQEKLDAEKFEALSHALEDHGPHQMEALLNATENVAQLSLDPANHPTILAKAFKDLLAVLKRPEREVPAQVRVHVLTVINSLTSNSAALDKMLDGDLVAILARVIAVRDEEEEEEAEEEGVALLLQYTPTAAGTSTAPGTRTHTPGGAEKHGPGLISRLSERESRGALKPEETEVTETGTGGGGKEPAPSEDKGLPRSTSAPLLHGAPSRSPRHANQHHQGGHGPEPHSAIEGRSHAAQGAHGKSPAALRTIGESERSSPSMAAAGLAGGERERLLAAGAHDSNEHKEHGSSGGLSSPPQTDSPIGRGAGAAALVAATREQKEAKARENAAAASAADDEDRPAEVLVDVAALEAGRGVRPLPRPPRLITNRSSGGPSGAVDLLAAGAGGADHEHEREREAAGSPEPVHTGAGPHSGKNKGGAGPHHHHHKGRKARRRAHRKHADEEADEPDAASPEEATTARAKYRALRREAARTAMCALSNIATNRPSAHEQLATLDLAELDRINAAAAAAAEEQKRAADKRLHAASPPLIMPAVLPGERPHLHILPPLAGQPPALPAVDAAAQGPAQGPAPAASDATGGGAGGASAVVAVGTLTPLRPASATHTPLPALQPSPAPAVSAAAAVASPATPAPAASAAAAVISPSVVSPSVVVVVAPLPAPAQPLPPLQPLAAPLGAGELSPVGADGVPLAPIAPSAAELPKPDPHGTLRDVLLHTGGEDEPTRGAAANILLALARTSSGLVVSLLTRPQTLRALVDMLQSTDRHVRTRAAEIVAALATRSHQLKVALREAGALDPSRLPRLRGTGFKEEEAAAAEALRLLQDGFPVEDANAKKAANKPGAAAAVANEQKSVEARRPAPKQLVSFTKSQLVEFGRMPKPPQQVKLAIEPVMLLLAGSEKKAKLDWPSVRKQLQRADFTQRLNNFDPSTITKRLYHVIEAQYVRNAAYDHAAISRASKSLGILLEWVERQLLYAAVELGYDPTKPQRIAAAAAAKLGKAAAGNPIVVAGKGSGPDAGAAAAAGAAGAAGGAAGDGVTPGLAVTDGSGAGGFSDLTSKRGSLPAEAAPAPQKGVPAWQARLYSTQTASSRARHDGETKSAGTGKGKGGVAPPPGASGGTGARRLSTVAGRAGAVGAIASMKSKSQSRGAAAAAAAAAGAAPATGAGAAGARSTDSPKPGSAAVGAAAGSGPAFRAVPVANAAAAASAASGARTSSPVNVGAGAAAGAAVASPAEKKDAGAAAAAAAAAASGSVPHLPAIPGAKPRSDSPLHIGTSGGAAGGPNVPSPSSTASDASHVSHVSTADPPALAAGVGAGAAGSAAPVAALNLAGAGGVGAAAGIGPISGERTASGRRPSIKMTPIVRGAEPRAGAGPVKRNSTFQPTRGGPGIGVRPPGAAGSAAGGAGGLARTTTGVVGGSGAAAAAGSAPLVAPVARKPSDQPASGKLTKRTSAEV